MRTLVKEVSDKPLAHCLLLWRSLGGFEEDPDGIFYFCDSLCIAVMGIVHQIEAFVAFSADEERSLLILVPEARVVLAVVMHRVVHLPAFILLLCIEA